MQDKVIEATQKKSKTVLKHVVNFIPSINPMVPRDTWLANPNPSPLRLSLEVMSLEKLISIVSTVARNTC